MIFGELDIKLDIIGPKVAAAMNDCSVFSPS